MSEKRKPYCCVCLREENDQEWTIFPFSFFDYKFVASGEIYERLEYVYRCKTNHGYDKGWKLPNVLNGMMVEIE